MSRVGYPDINVQSKTLLASPVCCGSCLRCIDLAESAQTLCRFRSWVKGGVLQVVSFHLFPVVEFL